MTHTTRTTAALTLAAIATIIGATIVTAGPLDPPAGPITATPGPEPRTAVNATNTPGDSDASPSLFKITQPGSYYLTGNITGVVGKHGIEIVTSGVTLDLNGFHLLGVAGSLDGVGISLEGLSLITVVNGSDRNWGRNGVGLGSLSGVLGGRIEGVVASGNTYSGISAGKSFTVVNCSANANASHGISTGQGCAITNCSTYDNTGSGVWTSQSAVLNCSSMQNAGDGISSFGGCTITGCTVYTNAGNGITGSYSATISGCSVSYNSLDCILCGDRSVIRGNTCEGGGWNADGAGIRVTGTDNRIEGNHCTVSDRGVDVDAPGNIIIQNTCAGNTTDWTIVVNNMFGPIIDRRGAGGAAVNGFSGADALASTHPNANFSY